MDLSQNKLDIDSYQIFAQDQGEEQKNYNKLKGKGGERTGSESSAPWKSLAVFIVSLVCPWLEVILFAYEK